MSQIIGYTREITPGEPMPIIWQDQALIEPTIAATNHSFIDILVGVDGQINPPKSKLYVFADTVGTFSAGELAVHKFTSEGDRINTQIISYTAFNADPNKRILICDFRDESQFLSFKIEVLVDFVIPT